MFFRPRIVLSKCIEFEGCRYNGECIKSETVRMLLPFADIITVCPEVEIDLGIPRDPIRIIRRNGVISLWQPARERDVYQKMKEFADTFLNNLPPVDGFILKARSPSCGHTDVKIFNSFVPSAGSAKGAGIFGQAVLDSFPHLICEDEGRLRNFTIREHFFTVLFASARFRSMKENCRMKDLVNFHSDYKYLFMGYRQGILSKMGAVAANHERLKPEEVYAEYEPLMYSLFIRPPRHNVMVNVIQHMAGYFSDKLSSEEKEFLMNLIYQYIDERIPLSVILNLIHSWAVRFNTEYILRQSILRPFPEELLVITDSGKGRKL